ncbi:MAG: Hsp20/alpha crystallin family protein [Sedimentisphaerales bacterium]|nr:Hsp20/alpha crystallin family protein [Sedimentisphaerales bacterium]
MLLSRWDPFYDMSKTLEEMDRIFNATNRPLGLRSVPRGTFPAINIYDQGDKTVLFAEIPGVNPDELELTVLEDTVTLKGKRPDEGNVEDRMYRKERVAGEFTRTLTLLDSVNPDKVQAQYTNGVLRVTLEKAEPAKAKKIKIQA